MPSHRQPDDRASGQYGAAGRRPIPPNQLCRVIPVGTEPPCDRQGYRTHPRRLCREHQSEHKALYLAYKNSSDEVDRLKALVDDEPNWENPTRLTLAAVQSAIANRERFMDAIQEEIRGREKHQARFIAEPDDGHVKWLQLRRRMHQECSQVSEQLRRRQEILLAHEGEERRRKQEAARAHAERQRLEAVEAAERRRQDDMRRVAESLRQWEARREESTRNQEQEQRREDARRMQEAQVEDAARNSTRIQDERQALLANIGVVVVHGVREAHQGAQPSMSNVQSQQPEHRSLASSCHAIRPAAYAQGLTSHASQPRLHGPPRPALISLLDDLEGQKEAAEGVGELPERVKCAGAFILMTLVAFVVLIYWVR